MTIEQMLLTMMIPVLVSALNAWVNITIKFAPDIDHAKRTLREKFSFLIITLCNMYMIVSLFMYFIIPKPLTTERIFLMVFAISSLSASYIMRHVIKIFTELRSSIEKRDKEIINIIAGHDAAIIELQEKIIKKILK